MIYARVYYILLHDIIMVIYFDINAYKIGLPVYSRSKYWRGWVHSPCPDHKNYLFIKYLSSNKNQLYKRFLIYNGEY